MARAPSRSLPFLLAILLTGGAIGLALAWTESPENAAQLAARWTARAAVLLFLVTYMTRPLAQAWPTEATRALLSRRRQWGLSFALAHTIHLATVVAYFLVSGTQPLLISVIGGGFGYLLIWASAATSNSASIRALGRKWKWLHRATIHYVWIIFFRSYFNRLFEADTRLLGLVFVALLGGAALLRFGVWLAMRNRSLRAAG